MAAVELAADVRMGSACVLGSPLHVTRMDRQPQDFDQEGGRYFQQICSAALDYNSRNVDAAFDGIHFDIEPHVLGGIWRENPSGLPGDDAYNAHLKAPPASPLQPTRDAPRSLRSS